MFNKGNFQTAYLKAMCKQAPRMYRELEAAGTLDEQIEGVTREAESLFNSVVAKLESRENRKGPDQEMTANEVVFSEMIQFPQ
jgi:hypothetical protein